MKKHEIHLVGCSHRDPNIEKRLRNAFRAIQPNMMTLEYPHDQERYQDFLSKNSDLSATGEEDRDLVYSWGREIEVIQSLYNENQDSLFSLECIDDVETYISSFRMIMGSALESYQEEGSPDLDYSDIEKHIKTGEINHHFLKQLKHLRRMGILSQKREEFQAARIRAILLEIFKLSKGQDFRIKLMHSGGFDHLADFKSLTTFYSSLRKMLPQDKFEIIRHLAIDFD